MKPDTAEDTAMGPPGPDPTLTLKRDRLADSGACLNCGTNLQGPFCHYCGQPDRRFLRFFPVLLREFMQEFLELDSRFARTMKPLLFRPGRLTRDYLEGRRFRYTPPLRLYLFSSIGFFLLAAVLSTNAIEVGVGIDPRTGEPNVNISGMAERPALTPAQRAEAEQALREANVDVPPEILQGLTGEQAEPGAPGDRDVFTADKIMVEGKPWNRETNPVRLSYLPGFANEWINDEIEDSPTKARRIGENPNIIIEQVFDMLPGTMFVLLPVAALLLKFWYAFARRYYIEHLIYALHNHAFIFVSAIFLLLCSVLADWAAENSLAWLSQGAQWAVILAGCWVPLYLLISLRHVYQQNWFLTGVKFTLIGLSYVTLLAAASSVVAILSFVLL